MKAFAFRTYFLSLILVGAAAIAARGSIFTLSDQNSTVTVDPSSQAGVAPWVVDGTNQLAQEWFWYRIGSSGGEQSLDTLSAATGGTTSANSATVTYAGSNGLAAEVDYLLTGGAPGSGVSDLQETITLTNTGSQAISLHFFQYADFDLGGSSNNDFVQFVNANAVDQYKVVGGITTNLLESVHTNSPHLGVTTEYQGDFFPNILASLSDSSPTTLNNTPVVGGPARGPGDMTWAYQWDDTLAPGGQLIIGKDMGLSVPEPSSAVLFGFAGVCLMIRARQWRQI